jgi:hypothetical protein
MNIDIRKNNCYDILELNYDCSQYDIINSYKTKISKFDGLPFLTDKMINEIKQYKIALYVLSNKNRREKYNSIIKGYYTDNYIDNVNKKINDRLFAGIF